MLVPTGTGETHCCYGESSGSTTYAQCLGLTDDQYENIGRFINSLEDIDPNVDIKIVETGLRPGEKLYEEILLDITNQIKTDNELIYIEPKEDINTNLENDVLSASKAFGMDIETKDIKILLKSLVKNYKELDCSKEE